MLPINLTMDWEGTRGQHAPWCLLKFQIFRFCRPRCHKGFKRRRNPRNVRWTKSFRKAAGKELTVDPSFEFEKRRNVPVKYNRELWHKTVSAMKRVAAIKTKREGKFVMDRLLKSQEHQRVHDIVEVRKGMSLIRSPAAGLKRKKLMDEEEMELEEEVNERVAAGTSGKKVVAKKQKIMEEVTMSDDEMKIEEDTDDDGGDEDDSDDDGVVVVGVSEGAIPRCSTLNRLAPHHKAGTVKATPDQHSVRCLHLLLLIPGGYMTLQHHDNFLK
ncbi:putative ribosome biogenesis protein RLP24 [Chionoecetes opilio]|uniref:Probable ribosome biogenesis protein RLP24 n=1 Tax=Chionoecetes opilio TaxID=41210 RepID=A0A8J4YUN9_CHIOP|nr:putative ribosome biogenesis protein RLP24 [Chionoecetes opilio]